MEYLGLLIELLFEKLAAGESVQQILESYPFLSEADLRAAFAFGAQTLRTVEGFPAAS